MTDKPMIGAALAQAKTLWSEASAAQVAAVKEADAARGELARLDALLAEALLKTEAAQKAQSASILAKLGFSKAPAEKVSAAESVLVGAAATVDALRTARPDLEAVVAKADAAVAERDKETRAAERAILKAKYVVAEGAAMVAVRDCRALVLKYHIARMATGAGFGEQLLMYTREEGPGWLEAQAEKLVQRAAVGE